MQFSTLLAISLLSPLSLSAARIYGIAVPTTIAPGIPFTLQVLTQNYIQTVYDIAIAIGIQPSPGHPKTLGTVLTTAYLGPEKSNIITPLNYTLTIDPRTPKGTNFTIVASLMSLYGVSSGPVLGFWNQTVAVGEETSEVYVRTPD
ncbi:hypothetical protein HYALB_00001903 [Hymenoscyphus albidus]|uniref:Uncharacterized protein n=1 Tax=Hymenoscyphus albidus TaxID=595503 RepID=A0A9N9LAS2_9HELO|nr:hypothetical protein HYALB_00001903 [Hymenoscyphus albidus]